jgi:beta-1,4-mannosyltransferase
VERHLAPPPRAIASLPRPLAYLAKAVWQAATLLLALPLLSPLSHLLVQTPPGVPTLPVLWLYCAVRGPSLVVDFHNYSHTILALAAGPRHPLVRLTRLLEGWAARRAAAAFCVSRAMAEDLAAEWGVRAVVLHDRPPPHFGPIAPAARATLLARLAGDFPGLRPLAGPGPSQAGLLVSSTSWTQDEDFGLLLDALVMYEKLAAKEEEELPDLVCVITGRGPQKDHYLARIEQLGLRRVSLVTPWLEAEDYPLILASADLGVCLHTSSSGLDLPMKVVDMFGCGLPVAAVDFPALQELVRDGENGRVFRDSAGLAEILAMWFRGFPGRPAAQHQLFRDNLEDFRKLGWQENWEAVARPVLQEAGVAGREGPGLLLLLASVLLAFLLLSLLPGVA